MNKEKTTMTLYKKDKKVIKDITNKKDYKTQADCVHDILIKHKEKFDGRTTTKT